MNPILGFLFFDPYFFVTIPGVLLALWAQMRLTSTYARYSQVGSARNIRGAEAARWILDRNGLSNVDIHEVEGHLSDHYDPTKRAVFLSSENFHSPSLSAVGVAAHEVGHAIQHKEGYAWLGLRMAMVGVTGFASRVAWFAILGGMILSSLSPRGGLGRVLLLVGILLFSATVFFQMITLPVEYDASSRAKRELERLGLVTPQERAGVESVLSAAALTYVAGMVTAMLELLRLLLIFRAGDRDEDR